MPAPATPADAADRFRLGDLAAGMGARQRKETGKIRDRADIRQIAAGLDDLPVYARDEPVHQVSTRIGPGEDAVERARHAHFGIGQKAIADDGCNERKEPLGRGKKGLRPRCAIDAVERGQMQDIPLRQHREGLRGGHDLLRPALLRHRKHEAVFQDFVEEGIGGVAAGNAMLQGKVADIPSRHARPARAQRPEMPGNRDLAEQPALLGGEQCGRTRRDDVALDEALRQQTDRLGKSLRRHQAFDAARGPVRSRLALATQGHDGLCVSGLAVFGLVVRHDTFPFTPKGILPKE